MPFAASPLLRTLLHLLLAGAVLLQAGAAASPCHPEPPSVTSHSGCSDDSALGQLCQRACALALNLPSALRTLAPLALETPRTGPILLPPLPWPPSALLRPPKA